MAYYSNGTPETRDGCPMPPYNSVLNPNFSTFSNQPQFPLNQGSNARQVQQNIQALSYFVGLNNQVSNTVAQNKANGTSVPYLTFKSQGERILYMQGQAIAAAKAPTTNPKIACSTIYNYINNN